MTATPLDANQEKLTNQALPQAIRCAERHGSEHLAQKPVDQKTVLELVRTLSLQGNLAAAKDLLEEACASFPDNLELLAAQADLSARSRDWELSERRWLAILERFPRHSRATMGVADAMRHQKKFEAAEALLACALLSEPDNRLIAELFARVAEGRADWIEAERRWGDTARRFPSSSSAWIGQASARVKLGEFAGAEKIAATAIDLFPADQAVLALHARVATHARNWPEAERRWDRLRRLARDNPDYWHEQARALRSQSRQSEAGTLLAEAAELFPDHRQIIRMRAELSSESGMWADASALWNGLIVAEPEDRRLQGLAFEANWRAIGTAGDATEAVLAAPPAMPPAVRATADHPRHIMLRFECFGNDSEFAMVQRHFGAEPLSLLRWSEIATYQLTAALNNSFDGIGKPETTKLTLGSDFMVRDRRFDFSSHTWVTEDQTDRESFFNEQCRRLKYLRRNLLEDIEEGEKILIYKSAIVEPLDKVKRLHAAIRKLGPATLLYVRKSDAGHPAGMVETLAEGLVIGYLDNLVDPGNAKIDQTGWVALLRKTLVLCKEMSAATVNNLPRRDLVQRFESLGNNCEFGFVQRREGAEPLGLLRWSTTKVSVLADAFEQILAGIGDTEHTELYTHQDYRAVDARFGLSMQTFVNAEQTDRASLFTEQCQRMRFLRQKLLADLRTGDKIFVHKTVLAPSTDEVIALHTAVRRHGPANLLHVQPATTEFPNGTVREIAPGLLVGYIDRLVAVGGGWDIAHESWLALCHQALKAAP
jgi:tetratricopeptide (TPR) repeat protein